MGPGTANKVRELLGWDPSLILGEDSGNAEQLSQLVKRRATENASLKEKPLLYPCAQMETMSRYFEGGQQEVELDKIVAYETCKSPDLEEKLEVLPRDMFAVVFFSPSGVKFALEQLMQAGKRIQHVVSIGPTTHKALVKALPSDSSLHLHQAASPSPQGVKSILQNLSDENYPLSSERS